MSTISATDTLAQGAITTSTTQAMMRCPASAPKFVNLADSEGLTKFVHTQTAGLKEIDSTRGPGARTVIMHIGNLIVADGFLALNSPQKHPHLQAMLACVARDPRLGHLMRDSRFPASVSTEVAAHVVGVTAQKLKANLQEKKKAKPGAAANIKTRANLNSMRGAPATGGVPIDCALTNDQFGQLVAMVVDDDELRQMRDRVEAQAPHLLVPLDTVFSSMMQVLERIYGSTLLEAVPTTVGGTAQAMMRCPASAPKFLNLADIEGMAEFVPTGGLKEIESHIGKLIKTDAMLALSSLHTCLQAVLRRDPRLARDPRIAPLQRDLRFLVPVVTEVATHVLLDVTAQKLKVNLQETKQAMGAAANIKTRANLNSMRGAPATGGVPIDCALTDDWFGQLVALVVEDDELRQMRDRVEAQAPHLLVPLETLISSMMQVLERIYGSTLLEAVPTARDEAQALRDASIAANQQLAKVRGELEEMEERDAERRRKKREAREAETASVKAEHIVRQVPKENAAPNANARTTRSSRRL